MSSRPPPPTPNLSKAATTTATTTSGSSSNNSSLTGLGLGLGLTSSQPTSADISSSSSTSNVSFTNMSQNHQQGGFLPFLPQFQNQQGHFPQQPQQSFQQNSMFPHGIQHATVTFPGLESDDEDENPGSDLSAIHLRINTPLLVNGNGNMVSINVADNAARVGYAVAQSLRQIGTVGGGVPMIDEDGKPRPIDVKVSAATEIRGSNNVVGEKAILSKTIVGGAIRRIDPTQHGGPAADRYGLKRERAGSEPDEMDSKKVRHD